MNAFLIKSVNLDLGNTSFMSFECFLAIYGKSNGLLC